MFLLEAANEAAFSFGNFEIVEMIYSAFGSFVGLFLALLTDSLIDKSREKKRLLAIRKSIRSELLGIKESLVAIIEKDNSYGNPVGILNNMLEAECIVWDSVKSSATFIELIYERSDEYSILISIYNNLGYLNRYEDKYDMMLINNSHYDREAIVNDIRNLRSSIVMKIEEYESGFSEE